MKHDPTIDQRLASAIQILHQTDQLQDPVGRTYGSIGVITSVLNALSHSHQLTTDQHSQIHTLVDTWQSVLYPPSSNMKKTG